MNQHISDKNSARETNTLKGLDSIRFICALWVVFSHFGRPPLPFPKVDGLSLVTHGIYNNLTSGPAAVIVFFVLSGFFIHRPFAGANVIPNKFSYFTRRYVRIMIPLGAAVVIAMTFAPVNLTMFDDSILWSLVAELVYYTLYPGLLIARRRMGSWLPLIVFAFVVALLLAATEPGAKNYPSFGPQLNWLLGLPCWLMGCWLADFALRHKKVHEARSAMPYLFAPPIWIVRLVVLGVSIVSSVARFHSPLGYPWTLNFFAILATAWLLREVYQFKESRPLAVLEWGGRWSYSLYLGHVLAMSLIAGHGFVWPVGLGAILLLCYLFALAFEFPSHAFARYLAGASTRRRGGGSNEQQ